MSPDIRLQRWFGAPDVVFDAYTDPDAQRAIRAGADWVVESGCDLRVGGEWIIRFGPSSAPYIERNTCRGEATPPRLRVEHRVAGWIARRIADGDHPSMAGWTDALTLTQRGSSGDAERGPTEGWNEFLDGLVARIQTRPAT